MRVLVLLLAVVVAASGRLQYANGTWVNDARLRARNSGSPARPRSTTSRTPRSASRSTQSRSSSWAWSTSPAPIPLRQRHDGLERGGNRRRLYRARQSAHGPPHKETRGVSTVMVSTDYPIQSGDTIYVFERFF